MSSFPISTEREHKKINVFRCELLRATIFVSHATLFRFNQRRKNKNKWKHWKLEQLAIVETWGTTGTWSAHLHPLHEITQHVRVSRFACPENFDSKVFPGTSMIFVDKLSETMSFCSILNGWTSWASKICYFFHEFNLEPSNDGTKTKKFQDVACLSDKFLKVNLCQSISQLRLAPKKKKNYNFLHAN